MEEAPIPFSKLKLSSNQVAGHQFEEGHAGSLVDDSGYFYKPLQNGERGEREIKFYEKFWSDDRVPDLVKEFFPKYHGSVLVEAADGKGAIKHAVLEDLSRGFRRPCIMDIKMGYQTWYPGATEEYNKKSKKKDEESTTSSDGLRLSGMQVYEPFKLAKWRADRNWCRKLDSSELRNALRRFVSTNPSDEQPNAALAAQVYSETVRQLQKLVPWFETQTFYHFYSSSVLVTYEGLEAVDADFTGMVSVKLVDFAHVTSEHKNIDESYLRALKHLIELLSEIQHK